LSSVFRSPLSDVVSSFLLWLLHIDFAGPYWLLSPNSSYSRQFSRGNTLLQEVGLSEQEGVHMGEDVTVRHFTPVGRNTKN
jgi:hypothetical protein